MYGILHKMQSWLGPSSLFIIAIIPTFLNSYLSGNAINLQVVLACLGLVFVMVNTNAILAAVIVSIGAIIQSGNILRLHQPIYPEQINGLLESPIEAVSMVDGVITMSFCFIAILIISLGLVAIKFAEGCILPKGIFLTGVIISVLTVLSPNIVTDAPPLILKVLNITYQNTSDFEPKKRVEISSANTPKGDLVILIGEGISAGTIDHSDFDDSWISYSDVTSLGAFTGTSLHNLILLENMGSKEELPNLFMYAKASGYETYFVSSRDSSWANLDIKIAQGLDNLVDLKSFPEEACSNTCGLLDGVRDEVVYKEYIAPLMDANHPKFIVWHMDYAHPPYDRHYDTTNYHEMTIRWTSLINKLSMKSSESTVIVTADHGVGHNSDTLNVPLMIRPNDLSRPWFNTNNVSKQITSNDMLQTLLLFLGFDEREIGMDLSKSDLPHTKDRYYDTGHGLKLIRETHKDKLQEVLRTLE